jgi:hypothetical protein
MLVAGVGAATAQADGVGSASARGTDPDAVIVILDQFGRPVTLPATAEYSAVTNCDESANTGPFIVRYSPISGTAATFRRTSTDTSTCHSENGTSVSEGTGAGTVTGVGADGSATVHWEFTDSPDSVSITLTGNGALAGALAISGAPLPLNGSPGGVWVFGTLPWPAA